MSDNHDATVLDVALPHGRVRALAWGPEAGRLALCLHGFPDSAQGYRRLAPLLAEQGFRVVAPFMRGYWPSELPSDRDYHMGALMSDALALHGHLGGGDDAILLGHDWGAWTANAIAAHPSSPFAAHISMALTPVRAIDRRAGGIRRQLRMSATQLRMSWYILFFQIPALPERVVHHVIPKLWRDWSPPGADVHRGTADALAALPALAHRRAAVSYYRSMARPSRPAPGYADLHRFRFALPRVPLLVLHGSDDGAMQVGYTRNVARALPPGSRVEIIDGAGHFVHLDQPRAVAEAILKHLAHGVQQPSAPEVAETSTT